MSPHCTSPAEKAPSLPCTFGQIVDLWPTQKALADALKTTPNVIEKAKKRNRLGGEHDVLLVAACRRIGRPDIDHAVLARIRHRARFGDGIPQTNGSETAA